MNILMVLLSISLSFGTILFFAAVIFVIGFLVGRNNPSLAVVNKLINAGKVVKDTAGNLFKK